MAMIRRWDPFVDMQRLEDTMNRIWHGGFSRAIDGETTEAWAVPLDVVREGDDITVSASIPGVAPENIKVSIEAGVLTVRGETNHESEQKEGDYLLRERRTGSFYRSVRLPEEVDADKAESEFRNGVLTIKFPKLESKKAKVLEIKVRS